MREFSKVAPTIWGLDRFKALSDDQRLVLLYFCTCRHGSSCGCFSLPLAYARDDLGWSEKKYRSVLTALKEARFVEFDDATQELMIDPALWFEHNPIMNRKHWVGTHRETKKIRSDTLRVQVTRVLTENPHNLGDGGESHLLRTPAFQGRRRANP